MELPDRHQFSIISDPVFLYGPAPILLQQTKTLCKAPLLGA